ncbi:hypothetical protein ACFQS1_39700 [Paractinoplanes rhizophilus]|jgi:hypothetical protein|uniref:Uncharacterized protein n=1 Tax=Paractinoplanes rhizophilus TaxID=1416877 RepID=A0ABW2I5D2_9ACTN|nr:hypothetical protein [Actinoplanes sp.]
MLIHADLMLNLANERHRELIAESAKRSLLSSARRARKARTSAAARGRPTGTLATCEPSVAVPAR